MLNLNVLIWYNKTLFVLTNLFVLLYKSKLIVEKLSLMLSSFIELFLRHFSEYLFYGPQKEASRTMFETAWRCLNDGRIVILRWTAPCTAILPPRPTWILPHPPQPVPYWLLTVTLSILCCQCQTDSVAEADRWSVRKGGAWGQRGHFGRGVGVMHRGEGV